jgi:hypothetical protein
MGSDTCVGLTAETRDDAGPFFGLRPSSSNYPRHLQIAWTEIYYALIPLFQSFASKNNGECLYALSILVRS